MAIRIVFASSIVSLPMRRATTMYGLRGKMRSRSGCSNTGKIRRSCIVGRQVSRGCKVVDWDFQYRASKFHQRYLLRMFQKYGESCHVALTDDIHTRKGIYDEL